MNLIAKIKGNNTALLDRLQKEVKSARAVKNGIVVPLNSKGDGFYDTPSELENYVGDLEYLIECKEFKALDSATVICDTAGNPMRPYYVKDNLALFAVGKCISVNVDTNGIFTLTENFIDEYYPFQVLKEMKMWSGRLEDLPSVYSKYSKALSAAREKLTFLNFEPVYIIQKEKK